MRKGKITQKINAQVSKEKNGIKINAKNKSA